MYVIFRCFFQQFSNYWKSLYLRIKIEIFILILIFYAFTTEKLIAVFSDLLLQPTITATGLSSFAGHVIVLFISLSLPFIYFKLLPRQESLKAIRILPLDSNQALAVLMLYLAKYELITLIICGPAGMALLVTTGLIPVLYFIFILIFIPAALILLLQLLLIKIKKRLAIFLVYYVFTATYFVIHIILYLSSQPYLLPDLLIFPILIFLFYRLMQPFSDTWDLPLYALQVRENVLGKVTYMLTYNRIFRLLPAGSQPYLTREFLGHLRNKNYMRMKYISIILFIIILVALGNVRTDLVPVACFVFCWLHYAHQFNQKYIFSESKDFIRMLPARYHQIWISKFLTEIILLLPILLISLFALLYFEFSLLIFMALVLFSAILLFIIINIRLLYLENARTAGYAYHSLVIFSILMIGNFYLVGPLVIFGLLIYLSWLSYRQFVN